MIAQIRKLPIRAQLITIHSQAGVYVVPVQLVNNVQVEQLLQIVLQAIILSKEIKTVTHVLQEVTAQRAPVVLPHVLQELPKASPAKPRVPLALQASTHYLVVLAALLVRLAVIVRLRIHCQFHVRWAIIQLVAQLPAALAATGTSAAQGAPQLLQLPISVL